jgi:hypothetical protein
MKEMIKFIEFNINSHVQVKLTKLGKIKLRENHEVMEAKCGVSLPFPARIPKEDEHGWSRWRAWDLMAEFGKHICMGANVPFETTIRIELDQSINDQGENPGGGSTKEAKIKRQVIEWISAKKAEGKKVSIGGSGGFFLMGMRWDDYIITHSDKIKPYAEAIRKEIVDNNIIMNGDQHQHSATGIPLFDDGTVGLFTYRAWGDIMAAIQSEKENRDYCYLDFYM